MTAAWYPAHVGPSTPALARRIRLVGLDVDGVMTDGGIYLGDVAGAALEFKRYDIQDGLGVFLLRQSGLLVAIVTGRVSRQRASFERRSCARMTFIRMGRRASFRACCESWSGGGYPWPKRRSWVTTIRISPSCERSGFR